MKLFFGSRDPVLKTCEECGELVEYFTDGQSAEKFRCHPCLAIRPYCDFLTERFLWEESDVFLKLDLQVEEFWEFYRGEAA